MRKILPLFFLIMSALVFAGCGSAQETAEMIESAGSTESMEESGDDESSTEKNAETEVTGSESSEKTELSDTGEEIQEDNIMIITVNGTSLTAVMEGNSSVTALMELLAEDPLTIEMNDYANMEKVGSIGVDLPRNDEQITTSSGRAILHQSRPVRSVSAT